MFADDDDDDSGNLVPVVIGCAIGAVVVLIVAFVVYKCVTAEGEKKFPPPRTITPAKIG